MSDMFKLPPCESCGRTPAVRVEAPHAGSGKRDGAPLWFMVCGSCLHEWAEHVFSAVPHLAAAFLIELKRKYGKEAAAPVPRKPAKGKSR